MYYKLFNSPSNSSQGNTLNVETRGKSFVCLFSSFFFFSFSRFYTRVLATNTRKYAQHSRDCNRLSFLFSFFF